MKVTEAVLGQIFFQFYIQIASIILNFLLWVSYEKPFALERSTRVVLWHKTKPRKHFWRSQVKFVTASDKISIQLGNALNACAMNGWVSPCTEIR